MGSPREEVEKLMPKQSLAIFLQAVKENAAKLAESTGIPQAEIELLLITNAALEGGAGETTGVGDNGRSFGRYQFNTTPGSRGHGEVLMLQGWREDDFLDDAKVVAYWAPIVVAEYQKQLADGVTGGEAMRQAIFEAEDPFEIYPVSRFKTAINTAGGLMGDNVPASGAVGDTTTPSPTATGDESAIDSLQRDAQAALKAWQANPNDVDLMLAFQDARERYESGLGLFPDPAAAASDKIAEGIALGDFTTRQAESEFSRFLRREQQATDLAISEINVGLAQNESTRQQEAARAKMGTAGVGAVHRASGTINLKSNFNTTLDRFRKQVAEQEAAAGAAAGAGDVAAPVEDAGFRPDFDAQLRPPEEPAPGVGNPWDQPQPRPTSIVTDEGAIPPGTLPAAPEAEAGPDLFDRLKQFLGKFGAANGGVGDPGGLNQQLAEPISGGIQAVLDSFIRPRSGGTKRFGGTGGKTTGKTADSFFRSLPGFANGVRDFGGGPAKIAERGPEIIQIPGMPDIVLGEDGPMDVDLPKGTNVIPIEQAQRLAQIRDARGKRRGGDQGADQQAQFSRANDPQLREKVLAAIENAAGSQTAMNPPGTPVLTDPRVKDRWAALRPLTGIAPFPEEEGATK